MQRFLEIANGVVSSYCENFANREQAILKDLEASGSTRLVIGLQSLNWEKAIMVIGLFSLFESNIQSFYSPEKNTFAQMLTTLKNSRIDHTDLIKKFCYFRNAINALKHGIGTSYKELVAKNNFLPFEITIPNNNFRKEGDISEIPILVNVDEKFISNLMDILTECYKVVELEGNSWEQRVNNVFNDIDKNPQSPIIAPFNRD